MLSVPWNSLLPEFKPWVSLSRACSWRRRTMPTCRNLKHEIGQTKLINHGLGSKMGDKVFFFDKVGIICLVSNSRLGSWTECLALKVGWETTTQEQGSAGVFVRSSTMFFHLFLSKLPPSTFACFELKTYHVFLETNFFMLLRSESTVMTLYCPACLSYRTPH